MHQPPPQPLRLAAIGALLALNAAAGVFTLAGAGCGDEACEGSCVPGYGVHGGGGANGGGGSGAGAGGSGTAGTQPDGGAPGGDAGPDAPPPVSYSFVVFGDNQFATESCTSGVSTRLAVPEVVRTLAPTFVMHVGDLMDHGYDPGAYAKLVSCYQGMLDERPFFPTPGNHDMGSGAILDYKAYLEGQLTTRNAAAYGGSYGNDFAVSYEDDPTAYSTDPSNPGSTSDVPSGFSFKTFYAMRFESAYVLSFEIGTRWWSNTPKSWVHKHLDAARADPSIEHLFVIMHHPLYSTHMEETLSGSECVKPVRDSYEQLFRDHDVTLVFNGHVHLYEHFAVPDNGAATNQSPPPTSYAHDGTAVHYVTTGGGGGPLPGGCSPPPSPKQQFSYGYLQTRNCGYHVTRVQVEGHKLTVSAIAVAGDASSQSTTVWDEFTLE
jgi:hypothetical protein